jgi:hypothetical protein
MNTTYQDIVNQFKDACDKHLAINTFNEGTIDYLNNTSQNVEYPYCFLRPLTSPGIVLNQNGINGTRKLTFEMYMLDVPDLTDQDRVKLMSDCEQYLYDIVAWWNLGPNQQNWFVTQTNITPVSEAFADRAVGWVMNITVTTPYDGSYCNFPQL